MSIQRRWGFTTLCAAAAMIGAALAMPARAGQAEVKTVLDLAPADAHMVLVVPNLADLNGKIAAFGKILKPSPPQMADVLGMVKSELGIEKGLDEKGSAALVIMNVAALNPDHGGAAGGAEDPAPAPNQGVPAPAPAAKEKPPVFFIIPVSNFADFLANFGGKPGPAPIELNMPGGETGYARQEGNFAILSPNKDLIQKFKPSAASDQWLKGAGKVSAKALAGSDILMLLNVEAMGPTIMPLIKNAMDQAIKQMEDNAPPGADPAMVKGILGLYTQMAQAVVRDATVAMIAGDVNDKGLGLTCAAQFKPGSATAKFFGNGAAPAGDQLLKLPNQSYILASTLNLKAINTKAIVQAVTDLLPKDNNPITQMIQSALPIFDLVENQASVVYVAGRQAPGAGVFQAVNIIQTGDAAAYIKANRDFLDSLNKLNVPLGGAGGAPAAPQPNGGAAAPGGIRYKTTYQAGALQIDGINVDLYEMKLELPQALMKDPQMAVPLNLMQALGFTAQSGYITAVGNTVVTTNTTDANQLKGILAAMKAGNGLGADKGLADVRAASLITDPVLECYLNLGGVARVANAFVGLFGMNPLKVPANLPPIATSMSVQDNGVAMRLYVPIPVITFVQQTIEGLMTPADAEEEQPKGDHHGGDGPPPPPR